jgi:hypothetical protein
MHARRLREVHPFERFQRHLLIEGQTLPSAREQGADIDLVRRTHNIEEGRPVLGAF